MFYLLVNFFRTLRHGFRDESFRGLVLVVVGIILIGGIFYWRVEGWRFLDALYQCLKHGSPHP
ncbi:MAG: hypothetical protein R2880_20965 [Deinococcales bacterium]